MIQEGLAFIMLVAVGGGDITPCQSARELYRNTFTAVSDALRDYELCVRASNWRDDCSTEFGDLELVHDRFEIVVADLAKQCH